MNIKSDLAGRRGVCPECGTRFRIPLADTEFSTPIATPRPKAAATPAAATTPPAAMQQERAAADSPESAPQAENVSDATATDRTATTAASPTAAAGSATAEPAGEDLAGGNLAAAEPEILSGDSAATWYVRPPSGGQYGPATSAMLKIWIGEGRVAKSALLWKDGWPQWREASDALAEIAESLPGAPSTSAIEPFSDASGGTKLTTPISHEKTSRIGSDFAGDAKIGAVRRKRSSRRITLVAVLATLVVGLFVTLILVASTSG
ncbi:GYF domain-containing protein [Stieleria mannarensis]|uniref:GYF domain-containing protein n=1 Tax=Stieleria mannarensis TaxID=2755585 RepID=UPI0015FF6C5B|nr:GYF domain-containing protein [Rhodopirellula sp. JC639]